MARDEPKEKPGTGPDLGHFEESLGYQFRDRVLLEMAITHRSTSSTSDIDNERLEFLGDAVLDLICTDMLYQSLPDEREGALSERKAALISARCLEGIGRELEVGPVLRLSAGEASSGGRDKRSLLANTVEALLGAIYLDGGLEAATAWLRPLLEGRLEVLPAEVLRDPKNQLQELLQGLGRPLPTYRTVTVSGLPHDRTFEVECSVGEEFSAFGSGSSKQRAQRRAAKEALVRWHRLHSENPSPR